MASLETSPFDLTGRRILISGAAGGIGSATARLCARQGAQLVLVDVASKEQIRERVGAEIADRSEIHTLDTGARQDVTALSKQSGAVYGLIDTAAIAPYDDWMAEDWEESLDRVIRANIKGPINLTRAFLPGMVAAGEGRIVLCGSVAGWMGGLRTGPHYAFSKGGIHSFVRWLSRQGAPHNVLVNGIAPGPVETAMTEGKGYDPQLYPLKRMAKPEEIAATAVFLCGAGSGYASGAIFDINGATHFH
jgi:NAD(P)-dependent dehydrogenase (short-subunit alcohol dehydrogenase family)